MSLNEELAAYTQPLCEPISEASPVGEDLSYDEAFEGVKQELDKLTAITEAQPDWPLVVSTSEELLRTRGKDFRLLVWVAIAKFHTSGVKGLVHGLALLRDVSNKFWDDMYPGLKRKRARANLLGWLSEQAAAKLESYQDGDITRADGDPLRAIEPIYSELDAFYRDKLGDLYPGMGTLRSVAREKLRLVPEDKPEPAAKPAQPAAERTETSPQPAAAASAEALPSVTDPKEADRAVLTLSKSLRDIARVLRSADPAQAWPYRLQRIALWLPVKQLPPVQDGRSRLPAPSPEDKKRLERLHSGRQWMDLLEAAETLSGQYIFWLDPHRMVHQAMEQLGALFLQAREAVGAEVAAFCQRIPGVAQAKFNDGTSFADPQTEAWLEEELAAHSGGGGKGPTVVDEEDAQIQERFEQAREMIKKGQVPEGLTLATQLATRAPDARSRFKSRLEIAELALFGGQPRLSQAILAALSTEADAHGLEEWEPNLCATLYAAQVSCLRALDARERSPETEAALFSKLSRLDPAAALRLAGN